MRALSRAPRARAARAAAPRSSRRARSAARARHVAASRGFGAGDAAVGAPVDAGAEGWEDDDEELIVDDELCDELIETFSMKDRDQYGRLLAVSTLWPKVRSEVLGRLKIRAAVEKDAEESLRLERMHMALKREDKANDRMRALLEEVEGMARGEETELEQLVAHRRMDLDRPFFAYVAWVAAAVDVESEGGVERVDFLTELYARLLALCESYDEAVEDEGKVVQAQKDMQDILSAGSYQEMSQKIDTLAKLQGGIDPTLFLTATKMYMSVKESQYQGQEEVKDVMAHLYYQMRETIHRQLPKEVRILKWVISMEDPNDRRNALDDAFTPGAEMELEGKDMLWTTPQELLKCVETLLAAYRQTRGRDVDPDEGPKLFDEVARMLNPQTVERMEEVELAIKQSYM